MGRSLSNTTTIRTVDNVRSLQRASWALLVLFPLLSLTLRRPFRHQPLWGDDSLLLRASQFPHGYATSFWESFTQTGSFKYRPLATPLLSFVINRFGNDVFWYQIMNTALIGVLAFFVHFVVWRLSSRRLLSIAAGLLVVVTRCNWYTQDYVFGLMEITALLLLLAALSCLIRCLEQQSNFLRNFAILFLFMATLVHERYVSIALSVPLGLFVCVLFSGTDQANRSAHLVLPFLGIPFIHVLIKSSILGVSPLTGGGESNFEAVKGPWILRHVVASFTSVFGWSSGYRTVPEFGGIPALFFVVGAVIAMALFTYILSRSLATKWNVTDPQNSVGLALSSTFGAVLVSSSLVIERIEFRWLFAPLILAVLICGWAVSRDSSRNSLHRYVGLLFVLMIALEVGFQPFHRLAKLSPSRISAAVTAVEQGEQQGNWKLVVMPKNWDGSWQWWSFAYGNVFMELKNPPTSVTLVADLKSASAACAEKWKPLTCTLLLVDGQSTEVAALDFRAAKYPK